MSFNPFRQHLRVMVVRHVISITIICLIVVGSVLFGRNTRGVFAIPAYWFLAILSCGLLIPLKGRMIEHIQRFIAAYLVVLCMDYLSGVYWPLTENLQIAAWVPVAVALVLIAWILPRQKAGGDGLRELIMAMGFSIVIIALLLLATGILVHTRYGFGAKQSFTVLGKVSMTLLAGIAAWRLSYTEAIRISIGVAGMVVYSWMSIS